MEPHHNGTCHGEGKTRNGILRTLRERRTNSCAFCQQLALLGVQIELQAGLSRGETLQVCRS